MTNVLDGVTAKLEKVPAAVLRDVIKAFTKIAETEGGRIKGYQLTADASAVSVAGNVATVTMEGVPSGFWVWRETGTKPHTIRPRRRKALAGGLDHPVWGPVHHPGTSGKRAWTKTVERATREIDEIAHRVLAEVA